MTTGDHKKMMQEEHRKILWAHLTNMALGLRLITCPVTFGYQQLGLIWGDLASGSLLIILGLLSLNPRRLWAPWGVLRRPLARIGAAHLLDGGRGRLSE